MSKKTEMSTEDLLITILSIILWAVGMVFINA